MDCTAPDPWADLPAAYAFTLDASLEQLLALLNLRGPWQWREGESFWYGECISTMAAPFGGAMRIYAEDGRFVINLRRRPEFADAIGDFRELHAAILTQLLPSIGASDIVPDEGHDWN